jgi:hypothetical protein
MKNSILKSDKIKALLMVLIVVGIVFFVLFSVYKNLDNLGSIRSISQFNRTPRLSPSLEAFTNYKRRNAVDYSSYPDNKPIDTKTAFLIDQDTKPQLSKVWGFSGVYGSVGSADNSIDVFYNTKSDMSCEGSELTKGSGNICLDKSQRKLLTSRGGNAQMDSVIG